MWSTFLWCSRRFCCCCCCNRKIKTRTYFTRVRPYVNLYGWQIMMTNIHMYQYGVVALFRPTSHACGFQWRHFVWNRRCLTLPGWQLREKSSYTNRINGNTNNRDTPPTSLSPFPPHPPFLVQWRSFKHKFAMFIRWFLRWWRPWRLESTIQLPAARSAFVTPRFNPFGFKLRAAQTVF